MAVGEFLHEARFHSPVQRRRTVSPGIGHELLQYLVEATVACCNLHDFADAAGLEVIEVPTDRFSLAAECGA